MKLLIKNGRLIDPAAGVDRGMDILVENGKIKEIAALDQKNRAAVPVIDAKDMVVAPGFIDMHVHLREPGQENKESIESGVAGGGARRLHLGGLHGQHRAGQRQPLGDRVHHRPRPPGRAGQRLSRGRRLQGPARARTWWKWPTWSRAAPWPFPTTATA